MKDGDGEVISGWREGEMGAGWESMLAVVME